MNNRRNYLNHTLADGLNRVGFRKWYERELLSSHAHMVLALLATIALLASFEGLRGASPGDQLMDLAFICVSAAIGLWALRRYIFLLMHAEELANQANCPSCNEYGRFELVSSRDSQAGRQMQVRCRKCAGCWQISDETAG